jgi:hypothetical protein
MSHKMHIEPCPAPDCTQVGDFCRGFCSRHYREWRRACIANGSWGRGHGRRRKLEPPRKILVPWSFEPTTEQVEELMREHG